MRKLIRALILLHRTYSPLPLRPRLHTLIRFLTCPFLRTVALVPTGARVLDVGAGHGLFSRLALDPFLGGATVAVAVEPDLRKVALLHRARLPRELTVVVGFDDCIRGTFDVVAVIDVLYKVPLAEWDEFLDRMQSRLEPGGLLIIKEQDPTARWKNGWNRLQERLASAIGLTLGESFSYETPSAFCERLGRLGFVDCRSGRIDRGYPHPHIVYTAVAPWESARQK